MNGNEEVVLEVAETMNSGKTLRTLATAGVVILVGGITYKYAIKPLAKKIKQNWKKKKEVKNDITSDDGIEIIEDFNNEEED